jgi:hypothetical protein
LIIVAYLPNERDIIMDRVNYLCTKIIYPVDRIRINCVYNTPIPIEPLETELRELQEKYSQLRLIKVPGSKSKADNLNYFFTLDTGARILITRDGLQNASWPMRKSESFKVAASFTTHAIRG